MDPEAEGPGDRTGGRGLRRWIAPWFAMTAGEQRAVALVLALGLLGLAVKGWRVWGR